MYELLLDRSTTIMWIIVFSLPVILCILSLAGLFHGIASHKSRIFNLGMLAILVVGAVSIFYTKLTPYSYYRNKIEPSVALGEEVFRRYEAFRLAQGSYP